MICPAGMARVVEHLSVADWKRVTRLWVGSMADPLAEVRCDEISIL